MAKQSLVLDEDEIYALMDTVEGCEDTMLEMVEDGDKSEEWGEAARRVYAKVRKAWEATPEGRRIMAKYRRLGNP